MHIDFLSLLVYEPVILLQREIRLIGYAKLFTESYVIFIHIISWIFCYESFQMPGIKLSAIADFLLPSRIVGM